MHITLYHTILCYNAAAGGAARARDEGEAEHHLPGLWRPPRLSFAVIYIYIYDSHLLFYISYQVGS